MQDRKEVGMTKISEEEQSLEELIAEVRLWTTNPLIARALQAVKEGSERKLFVEFDDVKIYSLIKPS